MRLAVHSLKVHYPGSPRPVLDALSLDVASGERLAIVGVSGCGKSSLLAHIAGLRRPESGSVLLGDTVITEQSEGALDGFRAAHVGFVFQRAHLLPYLSLKENIRLGLRRGQTASGIDELLAQMQLTAVAEQKASRLSVGEAQRTAVLRALVKSPSIVLADEPTGALDSDSAAAVSRLLLAATTGRSVVLVTHDEALAQRCDRVLRLREGRLQ